MYSIQPVNETKEKQMKLWKELILQYHVANNSYIMIPETFPYFENKTIGRKLKIEHIHEIMNYLITQGNAEWEDASHTRCRIIWKSIEALSGEIYSWVCKNGYINNIFTLFELLSGEEYQDSGIYIYILCVYMYVYVYTML